MGSTEVLFVFFEEEDDEGEKEMEIAKSSAALEKLSLCSSSSSPLWNGLVLHHRDVFVSHVIPGIERDRSVFLCESE